MNTTNKLRMCVVCEDEPVEVLTIRNIQNKDSIELFSNLCNDCGIGIASSGISIFNY